MSKHPIGQANPAIYSGVDRAERRRLAKQFVRLTERRARAVSDIEGLRRQTPPLTLEDVILQRPRPFNETDRLALSIDRATATTPITLLACFHCRRPTPQCTCTDSDGTPLVWNPT